MLKYIESILSKLPPNGISRVPASLNLFSCDTSSKLLSDGDKALFHTIVASLLYLSLRIRPDILVAVTFLCSRVKAPTDEDMSKLSKCLKYLSYTKHLCMRIGTVGEKVTGVMCHNCKQGFFQKLQGFWRS